ncbi:MAG: bis(5'-nucleosyl)-tetraphosphatase (symmetrical) YqeK [Eubacteriales bacterium]|nr:bis(5'-nucleosyl)-tetraphosphatase (symmetrical) YqeK [Eubacteriales bacterium]
MGRIGILSGTFDPVHIGHIAVARACLALLGLDKVLLAPYGKPLIRRPMAAPHHRYEMLRMACAGEKGIEVSAVDLPETPRYAIDTVKAIAMEYPGQEIVYIVGADKLPGIPSWREAGALYEACTFAVYPRAGYDAPALLDNLREKGARVEALPCGEVNLSSSQVRAKLRLLSDAPGMLLPELAAYIAAHGLYQPDYAGMVRQAVSASRFAHSLGVRAMGARLALIHGAPIQKAGVAGILHDCAKCMELSRLQAIARKGRLKVSPQAMGSNALLHGPVGALIAKLRYHIYDGEILGAIGCHTTGRADMNALEMVIFVADAIEPSRKTYPGLEKARAQAEQNLVQAALTALTSTRDAIKNRGGVYSPLSAQAIGDLESQLARSNL